MKLQLLRLPTTFERFTDVITDFTAFENLKGVKKKQRCASITKFFLRSLRILQMCLVKKKERKTNQNKHPQLTKTKYSTFCF